MRYHIDTIPVWDAIKLDGECFLCALKRKTEIGDEMIGARYVVFRDADGYELACLYCDTCVGLGNNWYDITAKEAAALDALLSALL